MVMLVTKISFLTHIFKYLPYPSIICNVLNVKITKLITLKKSGFYSILHASNYLELMKIRKMEKTDE